MQLLEIAHFSSSPIGVVIVFHGESLPCRMESSSMFACCFLSSRRVSSCFFLVFSCCFLVCLPFSSSFRRSHNLQLCGARWWPIAYAVAKFPRFGQNMQRGRGLIAHFICSLDAHNFRFFNVQLRGPGRGFNFRSLIWQPRSF